MVWMFGKNDFDVRRSAAAPDSGRSFTLFHFCFQQSNSALTNSGEGRSFEILSARARAFSFQFGSDAMTDGMIARAEIAVSCAGEMPSSPKEDDQGSKW